MVCSKTGGSKTKVFPRYFGIQMRFLSQHQILSGSTLVLLVLNFWSLLTPSAESPHSLAPRNAFCVFQSTDINSTLSHYPFSILNKIFLSIGRKIKQKWKLYSTVMYVEEGKFSLTSDYALLGKLSKSTTKKHQRTHKAPLWLSHTTSAADHQ